METALVTGLDILDNRSRPVGGIVVDNQYVKLPGQQEDCLDDSGYIFLLIIGRDNDHTVNGSCFGLHIVRPFNISDPSTVV